MAKKEIKIEDGDYLIIDPKTGSIVNTFGENDTIIHKEQSDYAKEHIINFNKEMGFIKLYNGVVSELRKELTPNEFIVAMALTDYISYDNCIIRCHKNILSMQDLSDEINMKYQTIRRVIPQLIRKGVIGSFRCGNIDTQEITKCYLANPYIYFRGSDLHKTAFNLFHNSGWKERLDLVEEKYKIIGGKK